MTSPGYYQPVQVQPTAAFHPSNPWAASLQAPAQTQEYTQNVVYDSEAPPPEYTPYVSTISGLPSPPLASNTPAHLQKPIAIPATSHKLGSPFLRAYPPALEQYRLPKEPFLRFLDNLNRVTVASPPLQILGLVGDVVSFVPMHITQIVGASVNAAAILNTVAISKGRTEMYLRDANRDIFRPRGLKVEIAKISALAKIAGMPVFSQDDKIDKNAPLLGSIEGMEEMHSLSGQQRRLKAIEPWIAPLEVTLLPEIQVPANPLSQLNAAASERMRRNGEDRIIKERKKAHNSYNKEIAENEESFEKKMKDLDEEEGKIQRKEKPKDVEKKLKKVEKERQKVLQEYEEEKEKIAKDRMKDDKEEESVRKIYWLIIRNAEDPSGPGPNPDVEDMTASYELDGRVRYELDARVG